MTKLGTKDNFSTSGILELSPLFHYLVGLAG